MKKRVALLGIEPTLFGCRFRDGCLSETVSEAVASAISHKAIEFLRRAFSVTSQTWNCQRALSVMQTSETEASLVLSHDSCPRRRGQVLDMPDCGITVDSLPEAPEGMEIAGVEVIVRLRRLGPVARKA